MLRWSRRSSCRVNIAGAFRGKVNYGKQRSVPPASAVGPLSVVLRVTMRYVRMVEDSNYTESDLCYLIGFICGIASIGTLGLVNFMTEIDGDKK
jgi:hypothetical protein